MSLCTACRAGSLRGDKLKMPRDLWAEDQLALPFISLYRIAINTILIEGADSLILR